MTVAVLWQETEGLWAAADTRFSARGVTTKAQRITDHGPKLLPLAVTVRQPGPTGFFTDVRLQANIGYMYAGEVNPALAAHALCSAVFQNLVVARCPFIPSLFELAQFSRTAAERYMRDWAELWPEHWKFSALIFGWCNINRNLEAYRISPNLQDRVYAKIERVDISQPVVMGGGAREFGERLNVLRAGGDPYHRTARLPLIAVEEMVAGEKREDVGGDIQLGLANSSGFQIMSRVRPVIPGKPEAMMTFLGIDYRGLSPVGPCAIGIVGVA